MRLSTKKMIELKREIEDLKKRAMNGNGSHKNGNDKNSNHKNGHRK